MTTVTGPAPPSRPQPEMQAEGTVSPTQTATTEAAPVQAAVATTSVPATATPRPATAAPTATPQAAQLSPPVLTGPEDGWSAPIGSVTFSWNPVPGATGYIVETRSDRAGQTEWNPWPAIGGGTPSLQLYYDTKSSYFQIPGTIYYWRVVPLGRGGQRGQPSAERRFVFQQPSLPPDTPEPPTDMPPTRCRRRSRHRRSRHRRNRHRQPIRQCRRHERQSDCRRPIRRGT